MAVHLRNVSEDLVAAYKINAFCVKHSLSEFRFYALNPFFESKGESAFRWWHPNARYVLPLTNASTFFYMTEREIVDPVREIVDAAAEEWRSVANEYEILYLPKYMDHKSEEYAAVQNYYAQRREEKERSEYERLRAKFEP